VADGVDSAPGLTLRRLGWINAGRALATGLLLLLVGLPLAQLFTTALDEGVDAVGQTLGTGSSGRAVVNTLWTSLAITVLAVAVGTAAAFVTERSQAPGRRWLRVAMLASLVSAPVVSAVGWTRAYGPGGILDLAVGLGWDGLFGPAGVVVVTAAGAVPLAYLIVAASLASRVEPDLERAARASGASAWQATRTVTLPLARPAMAAAAALVFVSGVNSFEVPAVLGIPAGFSTMTTRLYQNLALSADPATFTSAVILGAALVMLSAVVVGPADVLAGMARATRTGGASGAADTPLRRSWGLAAALWVFLGLTAAVPLVALVLMALTRGVGLAPVPTNWTLANFTAALDTHTYSALANTVLLAGTAATIVVLLGALTAALARGRAGRALGTVVTLTFAVSGSALAVAVLLAYGRLLYNTLAIILVAYLAKFWALGHRPLAGASDRLPSDVVLASRASGAGPIVAVRTIVAPLLRPAIASAWLLVFLFAVHELTISSLLYGPGTATLAVVILNQQQLGNVAATSALSVLLTLLIAAAALLLLGVRQATIRFGGRV
jgi:iron(III) transport system permease protein